MRGIFKFTEEFIKVILYANNAPKIVIIRGNSFRCDGRVGSGIKLNLIQFKIAPLIIAPPDRIIIGDVKFGLISVIYWNGRELEEFQEIVIMKRME